VRTALKMTDSVSLLMVAPCVEQNAILSACVF
jgi:hypothetical protein